MSLRLQIPCRVGIINKMLESQLKNPPETEKFSEGIFVFIIACYFVK